MRTITDIRMSVRKLGSEYRHRISRIGELSAPTHDENLQTSRVAVGRISSAQHFLRR